MEEVKAPEGRPIRLLQWLVKEDDWVKYGLPILVYRQIEDPSTGVKTKEQQLRSKHVGQVKKLIMQAGKVATPGCSLMELKSCSHPVVIKDMCAECGQDLRLLEEKKGEKCARVSMIPNIPELKISNQQAEELAEQDKERLHKMRKLVLLVDLDQTLIHTSQNAAFASICKDNDNFYTFQLERSDPILYTKIRPHCREFLEKISEKFELQIVTFGSRQYAHKIAEFIDPKKKHFAHRILSRDECINPMRKSGNLRHLFPCGDSMVCIIDDRDDVWSGIPNVVLVKKYTYFPGSGDINSPDKVEAKKRVVDDGKTTDATTTSSPRKRKSNIQTGQPDHACKVKRTSNHKPTEETSADANTMECASSVKSTPAEETNNIITESLDVDSSSTENGSNKSISASSSSIDSSASSSSTPINPDSSTDASVNTLKEQECDDSPTPTRSTSNSPQDEAIDTKDTNASAEDDKDKTKQVKENNHSHNKLDPAEKDEDVEKTQKESPPIESDKVTETVPEASNLQIEDADDYLKYLEDVLNEIHNTYYEAYDKHVSGDYEHSPDLRGVVPFIRSKVLYGCHLVLTGIIPNNFKGTPHQHKAYIVAKQLGAKIDANVSDHTTHLVGGKKGTTKYQEATKQPNVKFVSVDWLWACSERWDKVPEALFPIPDIRGGSKCNSREGTPPATKVKSEGLPPKPSSVARTYNPITGKLIKDPPDPRIGLVAKVRQKEQVLQHPLYSSLLDPEVVVPIVPALSCEPSTSTTPGRATRSRKPSMAEMMGIGYSLSSNDISEMDKEVDDLLSSDEEDNAENNLGSIIEKATSSSSEGSSTIPVSEETPDEKDKSDVDDSSSSSEEEFDHMAELLDHEMHYDDEDSHLDSLD